MSEFKGFIEVTPMVWNPDYDSENPFDGEYKPSPATVTINVSRIQFVEGNFIQTDISRQTGGGHTELYSLHTAESYRNIQDKIKSATEG